MYVLFEVSTSVVRIPVSMVGNATIRFAHTSVCVLTDFPGQIVNKVIVYFGSEKLANLL